MITENFNEAVSSKGSFSIALEYCGKELERLPPGHIYGPVLRQNAYLIQYCSLGKGSMEADGQIFHVNPGDCIVGFPNQTHIEYADKKDPWVLSWICLSGKSADIFFKKLNITPENPIIPHCEQSSIPMLIDEIVQMAVTVGFERDFLLGARLFEFFDELYKHYAAASTPRTKASDIYVEQAIYYLDMHYSRNTVTIKSLAETIGLNRSYLYEIFKNKTGISPQEYLTKLRVNKACELLLIPDATVASVAYSVGYEPSVFSKAFKRVMGITPIQYKELHQK